MTKFKSLALTLITALGLMGLAPLQFALAAATVTSPATANISSDSFGSGSSVALPALIISEGAAGDIASSTLTWALPAGFVFDTSSMANAIYTGAGLGGSATVNFPDTGHVRLNITSSSTAAGSLSIGSTTPLKVRVLAGTPMATAGNITLNSGTIAGISSATSFGLLTQVPGTPDKLAFTVQPPATITVGAAFSGPAVSVEDQFGNVVSADNGHAISLTAIAIGSSTPGSLSGTTTVNDSSGVSVFNNLTYSQTGTIRLQAQAASLTNATSNNITVLASPPPPVLPNLPNGTLVKILGDPTVYMVVNGTLRPFTTPAIFRAHGKKFEDVEEISHDTFEHFSIGRPVGKSDSNDSNENEEEDDNHLPNPLPVSTTTPTSSLPSLSNLPNGSVVKIPDDPTVFIVNNGILEPIPSLFILHAWGKSPKDIKVISQSSLASMPMGALATFPDGTLIKGSDFTVFVVRNGEKFGIPSMSVIKKNGWSLNRLLKVDDNELGRLNSGGTED